MHSLLAKRKLKCIFTKNNKTDNNKEKNLTNFLKKNTVNLQEDQDQWREQTEA